MIKNHILFSSMYVWLESGDLYKEKRSHPNLKSYIFTQKNRFLNTFKKIKIITRVEKNASLEKCDQLKTKYLLSTSNTTTLYFFSEVS